MSCEERLAAAMSEVEQLKRELEQTTARAFAAGEEMQHFVYAVSHDLRQPLRTVLSFAQMLKRQYAGDEQTSELTSLIIDGANEMNTLIEELLKYSRIENSPKRTVINLASVVQWAWLNLQSAAQEARAELSYRELPEVGVDESQFVQLFQQLLSNPLKFRCTAPVRIEVTAEEGPQAYTVSVQDNAAGIEAKYHEAVFAPFKRLHGREVPGTGLGLAICRKIVAAHGGRIWVESDGKLGSRFKFTIPF